MRLVFVVAMIASLAAMALTPPFAAAFSQAYEPRSGWTVSIINALPSLFDFNTKAWVYHTYGRAYAIALLLTIPAFFSFKEAASVFSSWGWRILSIGIILVALGVAGEYWSKPDDPGVFIGFGLDMVGTLLTWIGAALAGIAALRNRLLPRWQGLVLLSIPMGGLIGFAFLGHIPSGTLLGYVVFVIVTQILGLKRGTLEHGK